MSDSVSDLTAAERERLLDSLQERLAGGADGRRIGPRGPDTVPPASYAQRRLWFLDRLEPGGTAYNVPLAVRLHGALDPAALDAALTDVVARHEALRTTLREVDGEPVQIVADAGPVHVERADPAEAADPRAWIAREAFRPFDLDAGPLLRCLLLPEGADRAVLLIVAHHAVIDGWSLGVFLADLDAAYRAHTSGRGAELAQPPLQYGDFAVWQSAQDAADDQLTYWRDQLTGAPPVLELPTDRGGLPAGDPNSGATASSTLPEDLARSVRELAAAEDTTSFTVVLAAFSALLGRLAGSEDTVIGVPVAGRSRPELSTSVGYFLNTLALRTDLSGEPTFRGLLSRVRTTAMEAYDHQDAPFERVVEAMQPERSTTHTPIYQVLVNQQTTGPETRRIGDLDLELLELQDPPAKLPLTLYVNEGQDALGFDLLYRTALFSEERITAVLGQLVQLLEQVTGDPDRPVAQYSLVRPEDEAKLPDASVPLPRQEQPTLRDMVRRWVTGTPDAPALAWGQNTCSYAELWQRAEEIRTALAAAGGPRRPVIAVGGPRSPGLIAALLAVLAGDGVLLALDPRLPRLRRQLMLKDSGATHLVVVGDDEPDVPVEGLAVLHVGPADAQPQGAPSGPALPGAEADPAAAYLSFTSGTTGVPKAVVGRAAGLTHFLNWQRDTFEVRPGDRCAQLTGLSFDVVLRDVLLPLVSGATLCLPEHEEQLLPDRCLAWLAEQRVTIAHTVPTLARAWLTDNAGAAPALRVTFFAGEPLTGELATAWRTTTGDGTIVNLYGPTETTLAKCAYVVPRDCPPGVQPVGSALPGGQAFVRGPGGTPCGIGEVGEIVLRTPYRSLGYAGGIESSAWSVNPATGAPDDLLYATGDLGRLRPDGLLDILGRADRQVKIRGVRIETDEVAAVATRHPAVSQAAVVTTTDHDSAPVLVAYLVAPERTSATATQVRGYLGKRLPAAMVPSVVEFVDALPLTANGKIDWRALPPVVLDTPAAEHYEAPRDDTERKVAEIMAVLLRRERVGAHDSFFALGGHSLLAMQLASRLTDAFGVTLPLQEIFAAPTVAGIAAAITAAKATGDDDPGDPGPIRRTER